MSAESLVDFYRGKSIFLTGGSGFIGKVLIEKLLRSCPDIGRIYLLMRPARDGKSPQHRLEELLESRVFSFHSNQLDLGKLTVISGDLTKPNLGISDEDRQLLIDSVSIVIHSAATVRFHGPLKDFVNQNVLGTDYIMQLSQQMKQLKAVVYVSTAYANCNLIDVQEKVYPLGIDAQTMIEDILKADTSETPYVGHPTLFGRPNSYTMSKAIAELLVKEKYSQLPVVICRPSIVTHAYKDPVNGWCDSFNGLAGTLLLGGLGIARTMEINCNYNADIIPVDFVANSLIVIAYHTAVHPGQRKEVVHLTSGVQNPITWGEILDYARISALRSPSVKLVRPIAKNPISSKSKLGKVNHLFVKLFSHFLFAYLFDLCMRITRNNPVMVKVTKKMHRAFDVLEHFTNREWCFRYKNYSEIFATLNHSEQLLFESNVASINWIHYCDSLYMGSRRYLLNEDDSTIEQGIRRQNTLIVVYRLLDSIIYAGAFLSLAAILFYTFSS